MSSWGAALTDFKAGVQVGEVLAVVRTLLNDDEGIVWPDQKLFPKLRAAHMTLQLALIQNGVPIINEESSIIPVPAGTTDLSTLNEYPDNLIMPVWMKERAPWQTIQDFVNMTEVDFLPQLKQTTELIWWCWNKQRITTIGSIQDREVLLRYRGGIKVPQEVTDTIGPFFGELFLSYKTAALAIGSVVPLNVDRLTYLEGQASTNLEDLLINAALEAQNLPAKRRPYHRGRGRSRVLRDF